jgi:tRNA(Ile)-lysidine synthetase-like protein
MDKIRPGRYIVAVSGGVDSMVLLHMLLQQKNLGLVVAHVDHGIRSDGNKDCEFVEEYARRQGLVCITTKLHLSPGASEEQARDRRYAFLRQCRKEFDAKGIILAHHQDDLIETAMIAIMRGTGWRGLAPFVGGTELLRPLLDTTKNQLIGYARKHGVPWREDSTNSNERYLRNYIRRTLIPTLDQKNSGWESIFLQQIRSQQILRQQIEHELNSILSVCSNIQTASVTLNRYAIIMLSEDLGYELLQQLFRTHIGHTLERPLAEAVLIFAKVASAHKVMPLNAKWQLRALQRDLIVEPRTP